MAPNNIKISDIKTQRVIRQPLKAKIASVNVLRNNKTNKEYLKLVLQQGRSKIEALVFRDVTEQVKDYFKPHHEYTFSGGTFESKKNNPKFKNTSQSTSSFYLTFLKAPEVSAGSGPLIAPVDDAMGRVITSSNKQGPFEETLSNVKIQGGYVYLYEGCTECCSAIKKRTSPQRGFCKSKRCNNGRKKSKGMEKPMKICMIVSDAVIKGECGKVLENVVIFNNDCMVMLKKSPEMFDSTEDAALAFKELSENTYCLTVKRNRKIPKSPFVPPIHAVKIELVRHEIPGKNIATVGLDGSDDDDNASQSERDEDGSENEIAPSEKKKRKIFKPREVPTELGHVRPTDLIQHRKLMVMGYELKSAPPGAVLLINNTNYVRGVRRGSDEDVLVLQKVFSKLGFEIFDQQAKEIQNKKELEETIGNYKKFILDNNVDCSFVIVMGHGNSQEVSLLEPDEDANFVKDIMLPFSRKNFPQFQKPQVFFAVYCQGFDSSSYSKHLKFWDNELLEMLVCVAALPGYPHKRTKAGTFFINYFSSTLMDLANHADLKEILDVTQTRMMKEVRKCRSQNMTPATWYKTSTFPNLYLTHKAATSVKYVGGDDESGVFNMDSELDQD